jgi:hypothetical protein
MIQREVNKAVNGQDFFINDKDTGKPKRYMAVDYAVFLHYFKMWEGFHFFGYPQGLNWLEAPEWFNEIIKAFQNAYIGIQNFKDERAAEKARVKK